MGEVGDGGLWVTGAEVAVTYFLPYLAVGGWGASLGLSPDHAHWSLHSDLGLR